VTRALLAEAEIVQSIGFDQHEILLDIMQLYCPQGFELDPAYGAGGFYRHAGIPRPRYCFDLEPRRPECRQADVRKLPLDPESVSSAIFDPPWMISLEGERNPGRMKKKYGSSGSIVDTISLYVAGMLELQRVLQPSGILVVKCQDTVWGRCQYLLHINVFLEAEKIGFRALDLFIKLNKSAMMPWNMQHQNHARKMHSYFWVFKKRRSTR
jgi:hypothetical protein